MKSIICSLLILLTINGFCQNKFVTSGDIFGRRVFIKNNGQFNGILPNNAVIDYAYINGDEQVYFNKQGLTYFLQKHFPLSHHQREEMEHGKKITEKPSKKGFVSVSWKNSNPDVEVVVSEKQSFYHSFGDEEYKSVCYKKITYKNIYNNIDIEYVFTNEKDDGIKYNVVLHPGANVDDIKIKYSGDFEKIVLKNENIIIKTSILDITEHAPTSYQNNLSIESHFSLDNNTISFKLPNGYDHTKDLIIDPWVSNLSFNSSNYAFNVDYDYAGNYYVYGGDGTYLISKYTQTGTLLWTFAGVVPSIPWTSLGSSYGYVGNFVVDKISGKSYIGEGVNHLVGTRIVRIDQSGIYDNFITTADPGWEELWDMGFDCNNGTVFGLGGGVTSNASGGIINQSLGTIALQNFTGFSFAGQDIASHAIDPFGAVFFMFSSSSPSVANNLMKVNSTFNGNDWFVPSNYNVFGEIQNLQYPGAGAPFISSNGYNALAVNNNYLYYYDGRNIAAYNKATGASIGSTIIAGQTALQQGGIAVDDCDNVYVGGNGFIKCYHFNGTAFTANGNIPVASTTINKYVTDINYNANTHELYVCGSGFGGIYSAINSLTCSIIQMSVTATCLGISNANAVASVTTSLIAPLISYSWTNSSSVVVSQTTNTPALTNTVTALANGNYTVSTQVNAPCGSVQTQTFNINCTCNFPIIGAISGPTLICANSSNTYSVAPVVGAISYSWLLPSGWVGTSNTNTISVTANISAGTLSATATNTCGPSILSLLDVSIYSLTVNSGAICSGSSFTITPSGASTYTYSSGVAIVSPTTTTNYTVTGTQMP